MTFRLVLPSEDTLNVIHGLTTQRTTVVANNQRPRPLAISSINPVISACASTTAERVLFCTLVAMRRVVD
jgi:hypothetical protein